MKAAYRLLLLLLACAPVGAAAAPDASLEPASVPAAGTHTALLKVERFGRYAITAASSQGVALQLVDRMAGPGASNGTAGERDGRLDVFLERGEYRVIASGHEKASGEAKLAVHGFAEQHAPQPPLLIEHKAVEQGLRDFESRSYWIAVDTPRTLALEAAGRSLADLRLWRDGTWLVDAAPTTEVVQPKLGQPLLLCGLTATLEPGLYLLVAYGGAPQPWAEASETSPFYLRFGIPKLSEADRRRHTMSPFGVDRFLVPGSADYFRLELPDARNATLQVGEFDPETPLAAPGEAASINKKTVPPVTELDVEESAKDHILTVSGEAGQPYLLQHFQIRDSYAFRADVEHWVSSVHSGHAQDSIDASALVTRSKDPLPFLSQLVEIDAAHGFSRRANLLDTLTLFLQVKEAGSYELRAEGADASLRIEPFLTTRPAGYQPPAMRPGISVWELEAGTHVLTVQPVKKGIATISIAAKNALQPSTPAPTPLRAAVQFPSVPLDRDRSYTVYLNRQPGVRAGLIVRPLPLDLERPLAVTQQPGETVSVPIDVREAGVVRAEAEDGTLLDVSVDGAAAAPTATVAAGRHTLQINHRGQQTVQYSLALLPARLQAAAPLPALPAGTEPAVFPVLTAAAPQALDLAQRASATYVVKAERPGLYQLESTGLLSTHGVVRSRTNPRLFEDEEGGTGRNFQVRAYLREGDYQLSLDTRGRSAGHLGLTLSESPLIQGGFLTNWIPARATLRAGEAVSYSFVIIKPGEFRLRALGQSRSFKCRLEDADGWPLVPPGGNADITRTFAPGRYRIVILPEPTDAQVLTVIEPGSSARLYTGHGPHRLPLAQSVQGYWTEPESGAARVPDVWEWNVPAAIDARIELGAGMAAELVRLGPGEPQTLAQVTERGLQTTLEPGRHALRVTSARVDNRVWYRVAVWPDQLVPGSEREVRAPADVTVAIGETGLVTLASFGAADVKASLFDATGRRLAANDDRSDDWNFDLTASLSAGRYRLRVEPVGASSAITRVSVRVPKEEAHKPLTLPVALDLNPGRAAHVYPLGALAGELLLVSARSTDSIGLALESDAGAGWQPHGATSGRNARLEVPVTPGTLQRLRVWSLDRRDSPVHLTIATTTPPLLREKALGSGAPLTAVAGTTQSAARIELAQPGLLRVATPALRFCVDSQPCLPARDGLVSASGKRLLVIADGAPASVRAERVVLGGAGTLSAALRRDERISADLVATPGPIVVRAHSLTLQPGVQVGDSAAMAIGAGSAVAAGFGTRQASVWSASREDGEVHIDVTPFPAPKREAEAPQQVTLAGTAARAFALPAGTKRVRLALGAAMVAVFSNASVVTSVHAADTTNTSETLETAADTLTLLHTGAGAGQAALDVIPQRALTARVALQAPFEAAQVAAGTLRLEVAAEGASTLHVRGAAGDATLVRADGQVVRGRDFDLAGPATLLVPHAPGMLLAWLERPGEDGLALAVSAATAIQPVPAVVPLDGMVRGFRFARREPGLLHLRTATAVLSVVRRPGMAPVTDVHPRGALLDAFLPVGDSEVVLRALAGQTLSGSLEITATPVTPTGEGLGPEVLLEPGGARLFSFQVTQPGPVGVGVRAGADVVEVTLLDSLGLPLTRGVVSMPTLTPGTYLLALRAPADGKPVTARPALAGLTPPPTTPPADVVERYRGPEDAAPAFSSRSVGTPARDEEVGEGDTEEEAGSDEPPQEEESEEPGGDL